MFQTNILGQTLSYFAEMDKTNKLLLVIKIFADLLVKA